MEEGDRQTGLRGKRLHQEMERRVLKPYQAGLFEEALANAFKVLEKRLRQATDTVGRPEIHPIDIAFSPKVGKLLDPAAHKSQLEATYFLFRGAFELFRNPSAHDFTDPDAEQAFDAIVLANRLLLILQAAEQRRRRWGVTEPLVAKRFNVAEGPVPVTMDVDGDGEDELIVPSRRHSRMADGDPIRWSGPEPIEVYEIKSTGLRRVDVEEVSYGQDPMWILKEISLVDVDGDGLGEIVCAMDGAAAWSFLLLFKYRDGRFEALKGVNPAPGEPTLNRFWESWLVDVDGDGRLEIVGESWAEISMEQLRRMLPHGTAPERDVLGRMRYVWKWDPALQYFALDSEPIMYLGPRGLPPDKWEEIYNRIGEPPR